MDDEIKEEKLDSPLVVHKKDDASYQETAREFDMNATHTDDESGDVPTLERHRFRKEKKSHKGVWFLFALIAVAVAVVCALFYSGKLSFKEPETTAKPERTYVTEEENKFEGIIVIKGTYIFFEGEEVDGISGLEREIKYLDKGTKFVVQDENADSNFLNLDVLSLLSKYEINYEITHIVSSGLMSKYEVVAESTTNAPASTSQSTTENSTEVQ